MISLNRLEKHYNMFRSRLNVADNSSTILTLNYKSFIKNSYRAKPNGRKIVYTIVANDKNSTRTYTHVYIPVSSIAVDFDDLNIAIQTNRKDKNPPWFASYEFEIIIRTLWRLSRITTTNIYSKRVFVRVQNSFFSGQFGVVRSCLIPNNRKFN